MGKRKKPRKADRGFVRKADDRNFNNPYEVMKKEVQEDPRILWNNLPPEDPSTISARIRQREGKTTIVVIGTSPDTCGLVPWNEPGIDEIWALNDAHHLPFIHMDKITGWFQLHQPWRYRRPTPRFGAKHWEWLKEEHNFPIYMQRVDEEVPNSVKYPIYEIAKMFLWSEELGEWLLGRGPGYNRKYFSCSFAFIAGLAYYYWKTGKWGDKPLRLEIYGAELAQKQEYIEQRPNTEFWAGLGIGLGVQLYVPQISRILKGMFYAYRYPSIQDQKREIAEKKANGTWDERNWEPTDDLYDEDNVGEWDEPSLEEFVGPEFGGIFSNFTDYEPEIVENYVTGDAIEEVDE